MDAVKGLTLIFVSVWFTVTVTLLVTERSASVGDRDRKAIRTGRLERDRGVLGTVGAVGAERRRRAGTVRRPGIFEVALAAVKGAQRESTTVVPVTVLDAAAAAVATVGTPAIITLCEPAPSRWWPSPWWRPHAAGRGREQPAGRGDRAGSCCSR